MGGPGVGLNRIFDMPHIRFTVETECDSQEPSRIVPAVQGEIFEYRGKGIGAQVVRETIATFGSHCGLIACKPFPLQYSNWEDEEHIEPRRQPDFENKRLADFARVARFWTDLGFVRLDESDFYTFAPGLIDQPNPASDLAPSPAVNRVPRGRRRRHLRS
jgi:hypothetical protein